MAVSTIVSIDIGSKNIHIVEGLLQQGNIDVLKAILLPAPPGSFQDGKIEGGPAIKETIQKTLSVNKIKAKFAILTLQSSAVITREVVLPVAAREELKSAVGFEMEQYLPIMVKEYEIEHRMVDEIVEDNVRKLRVRAAAMPKDIARSCYSLLKEIKLKPFALDIHSNAISKLIPGCSVINGKDFNREQPAAFIDLGYRNTIVNIISRGRLDFSRSISFGGRDMDTAIANYEGLNLDKAEEKKVRELHLDRSDAAPAAYGSAVNPVKSAADQWINEIQKVFQYHASRGMGSRIGAIYLYGGSSNLKGFDGYMEQYLGIPTVKLESLNNVRFVDKPEGFSTEYFINAVAALVRY